MTYKREFPTIRLILSFISATVIFITIFMVASGISYYNYQKMSKQNNIIEEYLNEMDVILNVSAADCGENILLRSSQILDEVGGKLNLLEKRFGKNDQRVLEQKELYSRLEVKHLEIIKTTEEKCGQNYTKIIFFYSNIKPLDEESNRMGFILSSFKKLNSDKIMIYSFDYNLESSIINKLKRDYNITGAPIIVIDEQRQIYARNIDDLEPYKNPDEKDKTIRLN